MGDRQAFTPTPKQIDYLEAMCDPGLKQTVEALCEKAGISRQAYYGWIRDGDGFTEWLFAEYSKRRASRKPAVINAMEQKALDGDVNAAKVYLQTGDDLAYRPGGGVSVETPGPVTIRIARFDDVEASMSDE